MKLINKICSYFFRRRVWWWTYFVCICILACSPHLDQVFGKPFLHLQLLPQHKWIFNTSLLFHVFLPPPHPTPPHPQMLMFDRYILPLLFYCIKIKLSLKIWRKICIKQQVFIPCIYWNISDLTYVKIRTSGQRILTIPKNNSYNGFLKKLAPMF
jgi:hypothetical protein